MELSISRRIVLKDLSRSRGAFGWWEEDDEHRKKRSALLEGARSNINIALSKSRTRMIVCDYVTAWARDNSLPNKAHSNGSSHRA